jgi:acylphosphatase
MPEARRFLVSGRVQGVAYRAFVRRMALGLGLDGVARNLVDGRVEVLARGPAAAIAELERALRRGPRLAQVTDVESSEWSSVPAGLAGFETD